MDIFKLTTCIYTVIFSCRQAYLFVTLDLKQKFDEFRANVSYGA